MESGIAIGISIAALIVAVISPLFEYWWNQRLRRKNIESEYFISLFGDIIYQDLPKAREYIHYDGHEITGTDEIEKVLRQIRYKSIFYKQNNPDFYNHIVKQVQDFEDYLVMTKEIKDNDRFIVYHKKVDEYIANLCDSIFKCYQGR